VTIVPFLMTRSMYIPPIETLQIDLNRFRWYLSSIRHYSRNIGKSPKHFYYSRKHGDEVENVRLQVNQAQCMGCRICEIVCGAAHDSFNPSRSKVRIVEKLYEHPQVFVCRQCESPECVEACPTGALYKTDTMVAFNEEDCTSCFLCMEACPYDALFMYSDSLLKCNLCNGDPQCVKYCPKGVFKLVDGFYEGGD
jgi:carbon-monoxide dehydrogenase iron sulfur subunit